MLGWCSASCRSNSFRRVNEHWQRSHGHGVVVVVVFSSLVTLDDVEEEEGRDESALVVDDDDIVRCGGMEMRDPIRRSATG